MIPLPFQLLSHQRAGAISSGSYDEMVLAESTLLHFWPELTTDLKGGKTINLTGTTQVAGQIGLARSFNGTSSDKGQTAAAIDMSAHNKLVVEFVAKFPTYPGDEIALEFGTNFSDIGQFYISPSAGGNLVSHLRGNVNSNYSNYNRVTANTWYHFAMVLDMSLSGYETAIFVNGAELSRTGGSNPNNTGNFGNYKLNVGCRNGTGVYCQMTMERLAIYTTLTQDRMLAHYNRGF